MLCYKKVSCSADIKKTRKKLPYSVFMKKIYVTQKMDPSDHQEGFFNQRTKNPLIHTMQEQQLIINVVLYSLFRFQVNVFEITWPIV